MKGAVVRKLRERGAEFGTTTGRPRRIGWFDAVAARFASRLNGFTELAVTKLDVLDGLVLDTVPVTAMLEAVELVYETMSGWSSATSHVRRYRDLPAEARRYLGFLERLVGVPITLVSVGPHREATLPVESAT